ncbi:MAG: GtrA family protein [Candidatus Fimenecus sp.]
MQKIKDLLKKYREIILYVLFGGLTTVINYIIYFACTEGLHIGWSPATLFAWIGAVLFAYVTNRIWVFESRAKGFRAVSYEFVKFIGARLLSLGLEWLTLKLLIDTLHMDTFLWHDLPLGEFLAKTIAQILVIIANYVFSKWIVFRKNKKNTE